MDIQNYDEGDQDVSCDSKFMIGVMDELGNATRITYHSIWVFDKDIIYQLMDNAGGHGKNESVSE